ncbi:mechanosensitive ion channel domain-containing protein [Thermodesulfobacteriota bacterium]
MFETYSALYKKKISFISICLTAFLLLFHLIGSAAISAEAEKTVEQTENKPPAAVVVPLGPEDDFDRGVPRTSVKRFLESTKNKDFIDAAQHLDLRNLPREMRGMKGQELARQLKFIFDRGLWIDLALLSDHPNGYENDGLPSYQDLLGQIETEKKTHTLILQKVPRGDGVSIWKISNGTVAKIPELYELAGYGPYGDFLSSIIPQIEIFGAYLWQWIGVLIIMFFAYIVLIPLNWLVAFFVNKRKNRSQLTQFVGGPLRFFVWVLIISSTKELLSPTVAMQAIFKSSTLLLIGFAWVLIRLFDFYVEHLTYKFQGKDKTGTIVLLRPLTKVVRGVIIVSVILIWLDNIGFKVTTLMAGLGVGGIAIALAAQTIFADIIGSVILLVSQPVRVGDFCRFGNTIGTVEEIGLRASKIRTLDNTVVSVPNAEFSRQHLENYTWREKVWFHPKINLPYETTGEQINKITSGIEDMLRNHPEVHDEPIQVYFTEIGDYSHKIEVYSYVTTGDWGEYKKIAHGLNTAIMDIVEKAGARLALPSRKTYFEEGTVSEEIKA